MADEHLIEPLVEAHQVFKGSFLDVRRDTVQLPKQQGLATREYVRHSGAVMIVPILDDGRLVLERQYRHPIGQVLLEFPAGKIDPNESQLHCAQRELLEETGYAAREWACAGVMHNAPAYSTEGIGIWFARGLQAGPQQLDHGEHLEVVLMAEAELDALAGRGEMTDAKSLIALMWLQKWRAGQWPLHWQSA